MAVRPCVIMCRANTPHGKQDSFTPYTITLERDILSYSIILKLAFDDGLDKLTYSSLLLPTLPLLHRQLQGVALISVPADPCY